jgi:NAD(P)-dependent dehydrogenase (short-subunit alcohol dehydrogenase family)
MVDSVHANTGISGPSPRFVDLSVEAKYHVRANALLPGWTDTDLLRPARGWQRFIGNTIERAPAGRWADPGEFAKVAVCLADPSLTFHTGGALVVDGGYTVF